MSKWLRLSLVLFAVLTVGLSCQNLVEKDKAAVRALVEGDTTYFKGGTASGQDTTDGYSLLDDTTMGLWWRSPQTHDSVPVIDVGVEGDSAWVSWHQHNYGGIIHWIKTSDTTAEKWTKPLVEKVQLNAIFRREGDQAEVSRGWKLQKISLVDGTSDTVNTVTIDSLKIRSSLRDITIHDPLNTYYFTDSLVTFTPAEQLTLTLYTNATEGYAWLHAFWGIFFVRLPFEDMGNGVYQGTWNAQLWPGFRFAIFDLMTRNTLMDKTAPYDFKGWLFPYLIKNAD